MPIALATTLHNHSQMQANINPFDTRNTSLCKPPPLTAASSAALNTVSISGYRHSQSFQVNHGHTTAAHRTSARLFCCTLTFHLALADIAKYPKVICYRCDGVGICHLCVRCAPPAHNWSVKLANLAYLDRPCATSLITQLTLPFHMEKQGGKYQYPDSSRRKPKSPPTKQLRLLRTGISTILGLETIHLGISRKIQQVLFIDSLSFQPMRVLRLGCEPPIASSDA
ncbi:hypothetical protein CTheo_3555 [Ceratobasidium theobromae]|uniref:Uncharacterized protein n=1 Tax=Ceratobasidium theobromae TaxID=1582974 RepID=A0A5N5QN97_9AGAM|nr:hypothetical protein CTheo_3555 [Ceratobasidium theobromae]